MFQLVASSVPRWLVMIVAASLATFGAAMSGVEFYGYPGRPHVGDLVALFAVVIFTVGVGRCLWLLVGVAWANDPHPLPAWLKAIWAAVPDFLAIVVGAAFVVLFLMSVGLLKVLIPLAVPFWADAPLQAIDSALGLKLTPTALFTVPYASWQAAHLLTILWVLHWRGGPNKEWAVASFLLTWIFGMALAFAFSSAGPIFTGHHVADRLTMIEASYLWNNYLHSGAGIGGGISAFPSMHVAIACWVAFVIRLRFGSWAGLIFVALISLGAIALGWHYLADVPGGIAVAIAAAYVARPSSDRVERRWAVPVRIFAR